MSFPCRLAILLFLSACEGATSNPESPQGTDAATLADASRDAPAVFVYPNGEPAARTLYFRGTCVEGDCEYVPYDEWHTGSLTTCTYDTGRLTLGTGTIPGGAFSFTLRFVVGDAPAFALDPATTLADWSLPDGASALLWMNNEAIATKSTGSVAFEHCGAEVAGRFDLQNLCEYHGCSSAPWIGDVSGAFRCTPPTPVACGLAPSNG
jgi:hypothetical protein